MKFLFKRNSPTFNSKKRSLRRSDWLEFGAAVLLVVFVNVISYYLFARIDLTSEHRYTLSSSTKEMLRQIDEPVLFRVYLEGEFPADFKRLQSETKEMLNQFRAYSKYVNYEFVDPNDFADGQERQVFIQKLLQKGIQPTQIQTRSGSETVTQVIIPAADVSYKGREVSVQLLQNQRYVSQEELLNNSVQSLEYVLSNAIRGLSRGVRPMVGFVTGHGELQGGVLYDIQMALQQHYDLDYVSIDGNINALTARKQSDKDSSFSFYNKFDLLIVAKPHTAFSDRDLYILDQYVMYGGKVLWLIDQLDADIDSLAHRSQNLAIRFPLGLDEMFFTYGVRINADLVQDIRCRPIPMTVGMVGDKPQIQFCPWFYFPELLPNSQHPIVRNLDLIKSDFCNSIDLIDNADLQQTVLLTSSEYSRIKNAPVLIDLNDAKVDVNSIDQRLFNRQNIPVAVLVEGTFHSMFRNKLAPQFTELPAMGYRSESEPTKMIFVSDGDIIRNRFNMQEGSGYPVGYDHYTQTLYANKEFILNAVDYLTGGEGFMALRSRDVKLRKLDVVQTSNRTYRTRYQLLNVAVPSLLILAVGAVLVLLRRRRFSKTR